MGFDREIGKRIATPVSDRLTLIFRIAIIICLSCLTTIVESVPRYPRAKRIYDDYLKNRHSADFRGSNDNGNNDAEEYDRPLSYREFVRSEYANANSGPKDRSVSGDPYARKNLAPRLADRGYAPSKGMKTILSFPLSKNDRESGINGFEPGDPANDCLAGGVDAGVVDGAIKIGIGLGLAPGCGTSTEHTPRMVPVPVIVPRPIPVPVGVPQPYPVAIDVPRPVAIRVPMPIPFPGFNMGLPVMGSMQQLPNRLMTGSRS